MIIVIIIITTTINQRYCHSEIATYISFPIFQSVKKMFFYFVFVGI